MFYSILIIIIIFLLISVYKSKKKIKELYSLDEERLNVLMKKETSISALKKEVESLKNSNIALLKVKIPESKSIEEDSYNVSTLYAETNLDKRVYSCSSEDEKEYIKSEAKYDLCAILMNKALKLGFVEFSSNSENPEIKKITAEIKILEKVK